MFNPHFYYAIASKTIIKQQLQCCKCVFFCKFWKHNNTIGYLQHKLLTFVSIPHTNAILHVLRLANYKLLHSVLHPTGVCLFRKQIGSINIYRMPTVNENQMSVKNCVSTQKVMKAVIMQFGL